MALVGVVFSMGVIAAEFRHQQHELDVVEARLDKKIEIINEHEERLDALQACTGGSTP
jgi:hypothetical protein